MRGVGRQEQRWLPPVASRWCEVDIRSLLRPHKEWPIDHHRSVTYTHSKKGGWNEKKRWIVCPPHHKCSDSSTYTLSVNFFVFSSLSCSLARLIQCRKSLLQLIAFVSEVVSFFSPKVDDTTRNTFSFSPIWNNFNPFGAIPDILYNC